MSSVDHKSSTHTCGINYHMQNPPPKRILIAKLTTWDMLLFEILTETLFHSVASQFLNSKQEKVFTIYTRIKYAHKSIFAFC